MDEPSAELLLRYRKGDDHAADVLFERYLDRLIRLARSRLSAQLARRIDPEDVVMSACRSFFIRSRQGRFAVEDGDDLWGLLVAITLNKLRRQVAFHRADRRSIDNEVHFDDSDVHLDVVAREPTPDEAAEFAEQTERILKQLTRNERTIVERRLQGFGIEEIADSLKCSEKTVRRTLQRVRARLASLLPEDQIPQLPTSGKRRPARFSREKEHTSVVEDVIADCSDTEFVLREMIGAGGMGKVYRATHKQTGEVRAVKFLRKAYLHRAGAVQRFLKEASIVKKLTHPGIVKVHALGSARRAGYFIVMDLVDGPDLSRLMATKAVTVADAVRWTRAAASAIQLAHEYGVIHCDLKPSNLLLDSCGEVHVTDFGLARQLADDQPQFAELAGTAAYMAPEQVDSCWGPISERTDVYGLGTVLYTLLTNLPPYVGTSADVLAQVVCGRSHPGLKSVRPNVPEKLHLICAKCMTKNPVERYQSANEVAEALRD